MKSRAELHARAGRALEALRRTAGGGAAGAGRDTTRAAPSTTRRCATSRWPATGRAALFAYDDAAVYYRQALEFAVDDGQRAVILEKLGDAAYARGGLSEARERVGPGAGAGRADGRGSPRGRAGAQDRRGRLGRRRASARARSSAARPGALGDDTDNAEAARLYQELGRIHFRLGNHEAATEWARRALALGQQLGAPDVISTPTTRWAWRWLARGDGEAAADYVRRSLDTALAHNLGAVACRAYSNLAVMYAALDHVRSAEYCREGLALAQKIGDQLQQAWLFCTLAGGHCTVAGDYDEGVKAAEAAVEVDRRLGQRSHLPVPLIILAQIHQCRGEDEQSARYYREALERRQHRRRAAALFPCYDGTGPRWPSMPGTRREAERWLAKSRDVQETTGWTSDTFLVLPFLC